MATTVIQDVPRTGEYLAIRDLGGFGVEISQRDDMGDHDHVSMGLGHARALHAALGAILAAHPAVTA